MFITQEHGIILTGMQAGLNKRDSYLLTAETSMGFVISGIIML